MLKYIYCLLGFAVWNLCPILFSMITFFQIYPLSIFEFLCPYNFNPAICVILGKFFQGFFDDFVDSLNGRSCLSYLDLWVPIRPIFPVVEEFPFLCLPVLEVCVGERLDLLNQIRFFYFLFLFLFFKSINSKKNLILLLGSED